VSSPSGTFSSGGSAIFLDDYTTYGVQFRSSASSASSIGSSSSISKTKSARSASSSTINSANRCLADYGINYAKKWTIIYIHRSTETDAKSVEIR
jgi:hypothetical protein